MREALERISGLRTITGFTRTKSAKSDAAALQLERIIGSFADEGLRTIAVAYRYAHFSIRQHMPAYVSIRQHT
jgi:magnesium-transporting ATPase (P-type)